MSLCMNVSYCDGIVKALSLHVICGGNGLFFVGLNILSIKIPGYTFVLQIMQDS